MANFLGSAYDTGTCDSFLSQEFRAELIQQLQKPFEAEIAAYLASSREDK